MALLNTHEGISAIYLVPDYIQVNYQFVPRLPPLATRGFLRGLLARAIGPYKWRLFLRVGQNIYPVVIQHIRAGGVFNCYVTINVLRILHIASPSLHSEIPTQANSDNWLHPYQVQRDNRHIWDMVDQHLAAIQSALESVFADLCRENGKEVPHDLLRSTTVMSVEVCCDLRCLNPRHYVRSLLSNFATYLGEVEVRPYGLTPPYTERTGAGHMVSASRTLDERFKAYCKTCSRVRLECRLGRAGLRTANIHHRLTESRTFHQFFRECADHCAWYFNMLLQDRRLVMNSNSQATPFDLLSQLAAKVRHPQKLRELLDVLVCEGSISNNFDRQLIARLKQTDPPVLVACQTRGYSALAPQFRRAAWQLNNCQRSFSAASARRRPRISRTIRGVRPPNG